MIKHSQWNGIRNLISNVVSLYLNDAVVHNTCETSCSGQPGIFLMKGTLLLHEEKKAMVHDVYHSRMQSYVSRLMHCSNDIELPTIKPTLNTIEERW